MMKAKAFDYLNKEALKEYRAIRKAEKNGTKITVLSDALWIYVSGISRFGKALRRICKSIRLLPYQART